MMAATNRPEPAVLDQLTAAVGSEIALLICEHFGGRRLHIPHRPRADSELVQLLGELPARQLAKTMGALTYFIPARVAKPAKIIRMREDGIPVAQIASSLGCGERYVYKVLASYKRHGGVLISRKKRRKRRPPRVRTIPPPPVAVQRDLFDEVRVRALDAVHREH